MECQASDSKNLIKVFEGSKRKSRKKEGFNDSNSLATDDSNSACQQNLRRQSLSPKASLKGVSTGQTIAVGKDGYVKRERSSPSVSPSPVEVHRKRSSTEAHQSESHRASRSSRRHRKPPRDGISLALKAGLVSTPRSHSPHQETEDTIEMVPQDQDSFVYAFLEEAIKKDKKSKRHSRRREEFPAESRDRDGSESRHHHRHHHRKRYDEVPSRDHDQLHKDVSPTPIIDQTALLETFAKICAQMNEKQKQQVNEVVPSQSHKSLQCEVINKRDPSDVDHRPVRLQSHEHSRDSVSRIRSQENFRDRVRSREKMLVNQRPENIEKRYPYHQPYDNARRSTSKLDLTAGRMHNVEDDGYRDYKPNVVATRTCINHDYRRPPHDHRDYRDYGRESKRHYDDEKRHYNDEKRHFEKQTSRSFDINREVYADDDKYCHRTPRSDVKDKRYNDYRDRRYDERDKYFDERHQGPHEPYLSSKERRRRNLERFERTSIASREEDFRERFSERERDSGLSIADGENSTVSGRSNYLRVVKQEISEQREAMDKMMKLWKELMRCFKGISSQTQGQDKAVNETAANVRDSAAAQLRLWRECMRRYETVARDVGDTDARLMEEITKQRSEMSEMAGMWQECLQRYREISTDFNSLKQKLSTAESPTRLPVAPLVCAEGEGNVSAPNYRLPPNYPPMVQMPEGGYGMRGPGPAPAPAPPPAWWWRAEDARHSRHASRRRSSPESRGSRDRDRDRRHRHDDRHRDDGRYKEKSSKAGAARSEHRRRKR